MSGLVLASASASRQRMLTAAGVPFHVCAADLDEIALMAELRARNTGAAEIAATLAAQKAVSVSRRSAGDLVLGADSVLAFGPDIISKCHDVAELRALLERLSGKTHRLMSAVALARDGAVIWQDIGIATLSMRPLSAAFLDDYVATQGEAVLSSVGGYHYEGRGAQLFDRVEGDAFTILGLPLLPVLAALRVQGILDA